MSTFGAVGLVGVSIATTYFLRDHLSLSFPSLPYPSLPSGIFTASGNNKDFHSFLDDDNNGIVSKLSPYLKEIGFGSVVGYSTGYSMKVIGQNAAFVIGISFIALQFLNKAGIITINWQKVEEKVTEELDANNDGKLDAADLEIYFKRFVNVLLEGLPASGGFMAGFYYALLD